MRNLCTPAALAAALFITGCGDEQRARSAAGPPVKQAPKSAATVLEIKGVTSGTGVHRYDVKRLKAAAGPITIQFANGARIPHNVRIQTGSKCCFGPGNKDVGGTDTIDGGETATAKLTLEPGRYVFLCSIGGHWNGDSGKMTGTLVVQPVRGDAPAAPDTGAAPDNDPSQISGAGRASAG